jgi:putative ABC transport system substrate-binding protein
LEALRAGLRELGYEEGKSLIIEYRWAEMKNDRLPELAAELVRLKVDLIVSHGTLGTRAAKLATNTIPIVMAASGDAVATGLVASLARPGGNITGSTYFGAELKAKWVEILHEVLPRARRMAYLINPDNPVSIGPVRRELEAAAKSRKVELEEFAVRNTNDFDSAFSAMTRKRADAVVISDDAILVSNFGGLAELALTRRIPSIGNQEFGEAGGLIGYGPNQAGLWRRAAIFIDKILKGAKPADLPVEQPTTFEVVVNFKTAKALGVKIPNSILVRATKVIE